MDLHEKRASALINSIYKGLFHEAIEALDDVKCDVEFDPEFDVRGFLEECRKALKVLALLRKR